MTYEKTAPGTWLRGWRQPRSSRKLRADTAFKTALARKWRLRAARAGRVTRRLTANAHRIGASRRLRRLALQPSVVSVRRRVGIAFAISPLTPVAIVAALNPLSMQYILVPVIISYVHALIGGVGYLWLRDRKWLSTINVLILFVIAGLIPISFVTLVGGLLDFSTGKVTLNVVLDQLRLIGDAAGLGFSAGIAWRLIAGNPTNDKGSKSVGSGAESV